MPLNQNKVYESLNGFKVMDGTVEGPIYTGGTGSPVGLDFPVGTFYVQNSNTGPIVWKKYNTGNNDWVKQSPVDFYQDVNDISETNTISTTVYSTKCTIVTPNLPLGKYKLHWRVKWRAANANRGIQLQITRNSSEISNQIRFSASVSDAPIESSFIILDGISGVQTFNLNFKVGIGSTTIYTSEAYMDFIRTN